ncbi:hypothetical protein AB0G31_02905, partial [Streptomyces fradiae]
MPVGHPDVEEHHVGAVLARLVQGPGAGARRDGAVSRSYAAFRCSSSRPPGATSASIDWRPCRAAA